MYLLILFFILIITLIMLRDNIIPPIVTYKIVEDVADLAKKPTRHHLAACFDLYSVEEITIPSGQWREVRTGIIFAPWPHIYIPFLNWSFNPLGNIAYKIHTRSGLALKRGIRAHLGIIDTDYRNECNPILFNHNTSYPVRIRKGEKIAQVEFYRVTTPIFWKKDKLSNSARGDKGFGSSGK